MKAMIHGYAKAVIAIGTNPVSSMPNSRQVEEAFSKLQFFAIATHTMTPTARLAHIVLPLTTWLEESTPIHDQFTHSISPGPPAIEPIGEARTAIEIMIDLTKVQDAKRYIKKRIIPWDTPEEYYDERLKGTRMTYSDFKSIGTISYDVTYKDYERRKFKTSSGKVELYSHTLESFGQPPMPEHIEPLFTPVSNPSLNREYPLILITGSREKYYYLTKHREMKWARKLHPYPELEINTETAKKLGINNGDWVYIETPWASGQCMMKARCEDKMHPEVVHAPFGWYFPEKGPDNLDPHLFNINSVLSNDPPYEPIIGIPTLKPLLCKVRKATEMKDWDPLNVD
jgi:anaerobic selenocysteine-containing dehydrogenase